MNQEFFNFDFSKFYNEALIINLDFSTTSFYKRDFNSAFFHLDCVFNYLMIILEENLEIDSKKLNDFIVDLFANLMEICSAYVSYVAKTQGASQAIFYCKHLKHILEEFKGWDLVMENKLLEKNLYFVKSCVEFLISYSVISLDHKMAIESIEFCENILENISGVKKKEFLTEVDNLNVKLECCSLVKRLADVKNEFLQSSANYFLQSLAFSYYLENIFAKNDKFIFDFFVSKN